MIHYHLTESFDYCIFPFMALRSSQATSQNLKSNKKNRLNHNKHMSLPTAGNTGTIHRRNRDLDCILLVFLGLFVFLECSGRILKLEKHTSLKGPSNTSYQSKKNQEGPTFQSIGDNGLQDPVQNDTRPSIAVNWQHILSHPDCNLRQDENAPLPLVFMALGRTGSSITWATIAKILGDEEPEKAIEIVGRVHPEATEFFATMPDQVASYWPSAYICDLQSNFTKSGLHNSGIVGFQWKPYMVEFDNPKALSGLRDLAATVVKNDSSGESSGSSSATAAATGGSDRHSGHKPHPKIRVIYQTRNAIDRRLSNWKHSRSDRQVAPHCAVGDEECFENHIKNTKMVNFTTGKELLKWLQSDKEKEEKVSQRLNEMGVDYIQVTYEKLYMSNNPDEWMRIFRFLGRGPGHNLTWDTVQDNFSMMKTSNKTHKDMMENYDDVKKTLEGTEFQSLLT